ncbi:hypothetical protein [Microcoleus sp. herbarium12]
MNLVVRCLVLQLNATVLSVLNPDPIGDPDASTVNIQLKTVGVCWK